MTRCSPSNLTSLTDPPARRPFRTLTRTSDASTWSVNNAGYSHFGAVEEVTEAEARAQLETNFFGALWTTQAAIPLLRSQGGGHILQVSSQGGVVAFPTVGIYHASKWALEGLTEALASEVAQFGIKTTLIEPAATRPTGAAPPRPTRTRILSTSPSITWWLIGWPGEEAAGERHRRAPCWPRSTLTSRLPGCCWVVGVRPRPAGLRAAPEDLAGLGDRHAFRRRLTAPTHSHLESPSPANTTTVRSGERFF